MDFAISKKMQTVIGMIDEFVEREQAFYQMMTRVYLERDADGLKSIPEQLTKVISPSCLNTQPIRLIWVDK